MLTSPGSIRRPPVDGDITLFGTPDPFKRWRRAFDPLAAESMTSTVAASSELPGRIDDIVAAVSALSIKHSRGEGPIPYSSN